MTLRGRIVIGTAAALLTLFSLVVIAVLAITRTDRGREEVRRLIVAGLKPRVHGSLYVGRISEGFLTGVTIDSLAIRDPEDSLFLSTGQITARYDLRDLLAQRILLHDVKAQHPLVHIRQHENGKWNFRDVFPETKPSRFQASSPSPFIVIDSASIRNATFVLTIPWHPASWLKGAALDSAVHFELTRKDHHIRRTREGFARTWQWTDGDIDVSFGRVSNPDSAGMLFRFAGLKVNEADPPFLFTNTHGVVRQMGDSLWLDIPHVDLPGSTGRATGKIVWGGDTAIRYDIHVHADSMSLADIDWVYPTLPRTGVGTTDLAIRTEPRNLHLTDFALTNLDVRSTRSHLLGRMTFVTGEDTLSVKDVALTASPVNFDLLRTLNGKPFPYDWQGDLTGTVRASGGNLARFKVEDAELRFADAHVPGAITVASGKGGLNIFAPAFTEFHGFSVNVATMDLRTLQYLNKEFPRLNGTVSGTAVLDSSWLDVRFSNAQMVHRDGPGPESHVSGNGRVTWGEKYLTYDLELVAQPLALTTIRKSYPHLPLRESLSGPIRVQGQSPDLLVTTSLSGTGGTLTFDGHVDADPPTYAARGAGTVSSANLRSLLDNPAIPATSLNGAYALDVGGDSLPDFTGTASANLVESRLGNTTLQPSLARVHLDSGFIHVDTLVVVTRGATAGARGTLATAANRSGSLAFNVDVASLAEFERLLGDTGHLATGTPTSGPVSVKGTLSGPPDALQAQGTASARDVTAGIARVRSVHASFAMRDLTGKPAGVVAITADSLSAGPIPIQQATVGLRISNGSSAAFRADIIGSGTARASTSGELDRNDSGTVTLRVDSARVDVDSLNSYSLEAPVHLASSAGGFTVDSLRLSQARGGSIVARGIAVSGDSIRGNIRTDGFSLALLELLGSGVGSVHGALTANVSMSGTTTHPHFNGSIVVDRGSANVVPIGVRLDRIDADIGLSDDTVIVRRLSATTMKARRGTLDVSGTIALSQYDNPVFALVASAHNFRAVDRRGLATLDVSTTAPISLNGPYSGAHVSGAVRVDRGTVYIPELITKRLVDLNDPELVDVVDTTVASNRAILPAAPSEFTKNLSLDNVSINVGDDVWLRSAEANIKLGGSLNVTLGRSPVTGERSQLALDGQLNAVRGTYRLNVVPFVQPTFDVEQGTLRFFGTPDLDPALDITAINTVRRPAQSLNGQDIRIRATIGGTLSAPSLQLSSADNLPLSQSDLLSYLITGEPAFALDYTQAQYLNQLANVAVRSAGNILSSAIPRSVFDVVELQTPALLTPQTAGSADNSTFYSNLLSTRALVGKQLSNSLFLNFSTGFCAENFRTASSFQHNLGLKLEYRINSSYTAQLGVEPGTTDLLCSRPGSLQLIQQTPSQIGIDFLRSWRF
ncbi:MAG: translocation/assembly module TamB [Gemmatimonadota bacterium]|nr:translocation/assembly module TamB [Gemmatimonadota bacterium]